MVRSIVPSLLTRISFALPRLLRQNPYLALTALLFFLLQLFLGLQTPVNGELALSCVEFAPGPPPGSPLMTLLAQPFLLLPFGSVLFRLTLFTTLTLAAALFFFGLFIRRCVESRLIPPLIALSLGFSMLVFRNALFVSDIPLTLLVILLVFHFVDFTPAQRDLRLPFAFALVLGLGTAGLHPSIRFFLPPLGLLWLSSSRINRKLFFGIPLFFLVGFGLLLFLEATNHHSTAPWGELKGTADLLAFFSQKPLLELHHANTMATSPRVWWPNVKLLTASLVDSFPLFLLPLFVQGGIAAFWSSRRRDLLLFFGMGVAAFVHTVWMSPYEMQYGGSGLITLFALWLGVALGVHAVAERISSLVWRRVLVLFLLLLGGLSSLLADGGEQFYPLSSDHHALQRQILLHSGQGGGLLLSEPIYSRALMAKAGSGTQGPTLIPHERKGVAPVTAKEGFYTDPHVPLEPRTRLAMVSPWFGRPTPSSAYTPPSPAQTDALLAYLISRPQGSHYERRETARIIAMWGERFLTDGLPLRAFTFANYALFLQPLFPPALCLKAKTLLYQERPREALTLLKRAQTMTGETPELALLKARGVTQLLRGGYLEYSDYQRQRNRVEALLARAEEGLGTTWQVLLAKAWFARVTRELARAKRLANRALSVSPENPSVKAFFRSLSGNNK